MIQIKQITITEFRGIRDLTLDLNCQSFLVWGHNGSGKSGVVDAIDFGLTGNILRLSGTGLGAVSLAKHGPHVTKRDDPAAAKVTLTLQDTKTGEQAVLERNIKSRDYTLTPDIASIKRGAELAQQHPELTLSRREIIKYIISEPGKRATEVQALLKLDRLGQIRSLLRSVDNRVSSQAKMAEATTKNAEDRFRTHLDTEDLLVSNVLGVINKHRAMIELEALNYLAADAELSSGPDDTLPGQLFNKASALRDLAALKKRVEDLSDLERIAGDLASSLTKVEDDASGFVESIEQLGFLNLGLGRVDGPACPLCGLAWESEGALRHHLTSKVEASREAQQLQQTLEVQTAETVQQLEALRSLISPVESLAQTDGPPGLAETLRTWSDDLLALVTRLAQVDSAVGERARLENQPAGLPDGTPEQLGVLIAAIEARPDQSAKANARTFLDVAQDRWRAVQAARTRMTKANAERAAAKAIYEAYTSTLDDALNKLYSEVQEEFAGFYREINADDERGFKAQLDASGGKLDLSVDFYGQGMFPPAAYHSEGHQDGMGICLYLALVRRILGSDFRFAVLDDVLMSIDANHRRQFCGLLKKHFPDVQFIITTHDRVWAEQIRNSGLIPRAPQVKFHGWSVTGGPVVDQEVDVWERIEASLEADDISAAAARLRRHLESVLSDLAVNLRATVPYRPQGGAELGELMSAVDGVYGRLLKKATSAANSWNDDAAKAVVKEAKAELTAARVVKDGENWAVNPAVHFNEWETFQKADFQPVVEAWKSFLALFRCQNPDCDSLKYVAMNGFEEDTLRCRCGSTRLNLRTKK